VCRVDVDGDAWTTDCDFINHRDRDEDWCVATLSELVSGQVVLVTNG